MTPQEANHLERLRMARLLKVDADRLHMLSVVPLEDLKVFRDQVATRLFDEGKESWERAAAVGNLVPAPLAAKLAQGALGPVLSARTTGVVAPKKAAELSKHFSAKYLADVAVEMDPRVADELVQAMPPKTIATVGRELAARQEWLVMADFVGAISRPALQATIDALDPESILRIATFLEDPDRLDEVVSMLSDTRLADLVGTAGELDLDTELGRLVEQLGEIQRARVPTG